MILLEVPLCNTAGIYSDLGYRQIQIKEYSKAELNLKKSIYLYKECNPPESHNLGKALSYLGEVYRQQERFPQAVTLLQEATVAFSNTNQRNNIPFISALLTLTDVALASNNIEVARKGCQELLNRIHLAFPIWQNLSYYQEGEVITKKAYNLTRQLFLDDNMMLVIDATQTVMFMLMSQSKYDEAANLLVIAILECHNHPQVNKTENEKLLKSFAFITSMIKKQGESTEEYESRIETILKNMKG